MSLLKWSGTVRLSVFVFDVWRLVAFFIVSSILKQIHSNISIHANVGTRISNWRSIGSRLPSINTKFYASLESVCKGRLLLNGSLEWDGESDRAADRSTRIKLLKSWSAIPCGGIPLRDWNATIHIKFRRWRRKQKCDGLDWRRWLLVTVELKEPPHEWISRGAYQVSHPKPWMIIIVISDAVHTFYNALV
jgi:hypothetical protein